MTRFLFFAERWLWLAFLFLLPFQSRIILWQSDWIFIEWHAISLFVWDIALISLFAVAFWRGWRPFDGAKINRALITLGALSLCSVAWAINVPIALYATIRLVEGILLFWYVRRVIHENMLAPSIIAFSVAMIFQAMLGIGQFFVHHDFRLWILGEPSISPTMHGVAVFFSLTGERVMRAYGTFPHPNIFAAFLTASLWGIAWLWRHTSSLRMRIMWLCTAMVLGVALATTFSRTIVAVLIAAITVLMVNVWRRQSYMKYVFSVIVAMLIFASIVWPATIARLKISGGDEAVAMRVEYAKDALYSGNGFFGKINLFGVGAGNFTYWLADAVPNMPRYWYQPAHNIFLMAYSEIGLIGLLIFIGFLVLQFRTNASIEIKALALIFVIVGLTDHFFWTLAQGQMLWWIVLGLLTKHDILGHHGQN